MEPSWSFQVSCGSVWLIEDVRDKRLLFQPCLKDPNQGQNDLPMDEEALIISVQQQESALSPNLMIRQQRVPETIAVFR